MKLRFEFGGAKYSAAGIFEFTKTSMTDFWREPFFHFYPDVDRKKYHAMSDPDRLDFLHTYFEAFYAAHRSEIENKLSEYNAHWQIYEPQIIAALQDIFGVELDDVFNDLVCYTTFNPICPRYLDKNSFDNFYLESKAGALGTAMHEIIHFVWFYVWQERFGDDTAEYETPHLKWILSEMVVEPIMRDDRLGPINPYYTHQSCVYPYFYTMQIEGKPILDVLYEMLSSMPMPKFMEKSYQLCVEHETEIRRHIEGAEKGEWA